MAQLGNIVFIVWRESIEALLVIGILNAWLAQQADAGARRGRLFLWAGVVAGLLAAVALGLVLMRAEDVFGEDGQLLFQTGMVLVAAALIVQMVLWMRRHGRTLKRDLETSLQGAADRSNWWGVFLLAGIAVAREGSETVVFLAGTLSAARTDTLGSVMLAILAGLAIAIATYGLLQLGGRVLSWRTFFRVTEIMLLLLAGSMLITGVDNLIGLDLIPRLSGRLWDTSWVLPDTGTVGGLLSSLAGYRARPDLAQVLVYVAYWGLMAWLLLRPGRAAR